jgi:rSAM/selenodomain-associated transferase 2
MAPEPVRVGLSIIIPARNEATLIQLAIRRLLETAGGIPLEIIVVDGQSNDDTAARAVASGARVIPSPVSRRAYQMALGAAAARFDLLLFLHADTQLPEGWSDVIVETFLHRVPPPAAAAFRLSFDTPRRLYKLLALFANLRTWMTGVPQGDQALVMTRSCYVAAGGFPDVPLMEEYLFIPRLRAHGRIHIFRAAVRTSCRRHEARGPIRNALRNMGLILLFYGGVSPDRLACWYRV